MIFTVYMNIVYLKGINTLRLQLSMYFHKSFEQLPCFAKTITVDRTPYYNSILYNIVIEVLSRYIIITYIAHRVPRGIGDDIILIIITQGITCKTLSILTFNTAIIKHDLHGCRRIPFFSFYFFIFRNDYRRKRNNYYGNKMFF